jgi:hypothetical protein
VLPERFQKFFLKRNKWKVRIYRHPQARIFEKRKKQKIRVKYFPMATRNPESWSRSSKTIVVVVGSSPAGDIYLHSIYPFVSPILVFQLFGTKSGNLEGVGSPVGYRRAVSVLRC